MGLLRSLRAGEREHLRRLDRELIPVLDPAGFVGLGDEIGHVRGVGSKLGFELVVLRGEIVVVEDLLSGGGACGMKIGTPDGAHEGDR